MRKILTMTLLALPLLLTCCKRGNYDVIGMFASQGPDVESRFRQSMKYNESMPTVTYQAASDNYRLFVCTDVHVDTVTTELDAFVQTVLTDDNHVGVVLCLGDLQNAYGNLPRFLESIKPLEDSPDVDFVSVPGNHDLYYKLWADYSRHFGTGSFYFYIQTPGGDRDLFLCLDSASGVIGRSQRLWAESVLEASRDCRHKVLCTHTHFFKIDHSQGHTSNYPMEETMELLAMISRCGVDYVMTGHDHTAEETMYNGVMFRVFPAMAHYEQKSYYSVVEFGQKIKATDKCIR